MKEFASYTIEEVRKCIEGTPEIATLKVRPGHVPDYAAYTFTGYKIIKEDLYGHNPKENRYDLMEAVMICLGKEEEVEKGNRLHGVLSTLLSDKLSPREKEKILEEEYEIETTVEMEGGMQQMCNLSERIEERGIKKGIEKGIEKGFEQGMEVGKFSTLASLVAKGLLEKETAAAELGIPVEEFLEEMQKNGL